MINVEYPYALTKRLGEELVLHWSNVYNTIHIITFLMYMDQDLEHQEHMAQFLEFFYPQKLAKNHLL